MHNSFRRTLEFKLYLAITILALAGSLLSHTAMMVQKDVNGTAVPICTAFGIELLTLDENGNELPDQPQKATRVCPFCLTSSATLTLPEFKTDLKALYTKTLLAQPPFQTQSIKISNASKSYDIRGPPSFS